MAERAGLGNALRYLLTGDEFTAETALRLGFVQEVVAPGSERQRAIEIATLITTLGRRVARGKKEGRSQQAPLAVAATLANARKAVFEGPNVAAAQLQREQRRLQASEDAAEGVRSFIENGRPNSWGADLWWAFTTLPESVATAEQVARPDPKKFQRRCHPAGNERVWHRG